jgi:hypothetical protein
MRVCGLQRLWAMKERIDVPLASIETVLVDGEQARAGALGTRNPSTSVPGLLTAGTFNEGVAHTFWDLHNTANAQVLNVNYAIGTRGDSI